MPKVTLHINVDKALTEKLAPLFLERGITLDQAVGLYLRGMVNASDRSRALRLSDTMPFGKWQGETVDTLVRLEPDYVLFIIGLGKTRFDPEVYALLEKITGEKEESA